MAKDCAYVFSGLIDRDAEGLPLGDVRAHEALNLAVVREGLVNDLLHGYGHPLAA